MTTGNGAKLAGFLLGVLALFSIPTVLTGGLYVSKHEGDMIHLLQTLLRMSEGDIPHLDFMTPLGALGFAPAAALISQGMGVGMAMIWSQILFGLLLLPAVWWVVFSRMNGRVGYVFGAIVMLLCVALMQGTSETDVSMSMHYNRWCWAISFIVLALAILPSHRRNPIADGLVLGVAMALILMIKATYFIGFAPAAIVGFLMAKNTKALGIGIGVGALILCGITVFTGIEYWMAYLGDLLAVASSEHRAGATLPLNDVIASPAYIPATAVILASIVLLRQGTTPVAGTVLLTAAPGFWYVTYQNYENEPQWLILLALLLWVLRPTSDVVNRQGWNIRNLMSGTSIAAAFLIAPTVINLAYSPFRHMQASAEEFSPFLANNAQHHDFRLFNQRAFRIDQRRATPANLAGGDAFSKLAKRADAVEWQGQAFPFCTTDVGFVNWYQTIVVQLQGAGFGQAKIFMTDILSPLSIFGDFPALQRGAPWYYGNLSGLPDADYILVPFCPITDPLRTDIIEQLIEIDVPVSEVQRSDLFVLYRINR